jgi:hypothetical protein
MDEKRFAGLPASQPIFPTLLWVFHAVHHSQREMNVFTDFRVHAVEASVDTQIQPLMDTANPAIN